MNFRLFMGGMLAIGAIFLSLLWPVATIAPAATAIVTGKFSSMALFSLLKWRCGDYVGDIFAQRFLSRAAARMVAVLFLVGAAFWLLWVVYDAYTLSFWDGFFPGFILFGAVLLRGARKPKVEPELS